MDGASLALGAVSAARSVKNPIKQVRHLSAQSYNYFLTGEGAEQYAIEHQFEMTNMSTPRAYDI